MKTLIRLFEEMKKDDIAGESAKIAYYFFLSLFPPILPLFALSGIIGGEDVLNWVMAQIQSAAATAEYLSRFVRDVTQRPRPDVLSIGVLLTLWSASAGVVALATGLNRMHDIEDGRNWWKRRAIGLGVPFRWSCC